MDFIDLCCSSMFCQWHRVYFRNDKKRLMLSIVLCDRLKIRVHSCVQNSDGKFEIPPNVEYLCDSLSHVSHYLVLSCCESSWMMMFNINARLFWNGAHKSSKQIFPLGLKVPQKAFSTKGYDVISDNKFVTIPSSRQTKRSVIIMKELSTSSPSFTVNISVAALEMREYKWKLFEDGKTFHIFSFKVNIILQLRWLFAFSPPTLMKSSEPRLNCVLGAWNANSEREVKQA